MIPWIPPREVVGSLPPEVFKNHEDVAFRDVVSGHGEDGLTAEQGHLKSFLTLMM